MGSVCVGHCTQQKPYSMLICAKDYPTGNHQFAGADIVRMVEGAGCPLVCSEPPVRLESLQQSGLPGLQHSGSPSAHSTKFVRQDER